MGWLDSLWPSSRTDDPFGKLDPKLREYLEKESPVRYGGSSSNNTTTAPASTSRQPKTPTPAEIEAARRAFTESDKAEPAVPTESLYQDGRYAHLWKGYKPLAQIENETKSDHEKLMDVLEGFKDRKEQIGRAALENCALEQSDWRSCMSNPSVTERLTLCRTQVKKFEKCYTQQTRLLKALGYLSTLDRSPQVEEDIQMHADALYQKMQAQEAEIDAAKAEGRPLPTFEPLIPKRAVGSIGPERQLTPEQQADLRARLAKVPEEEKSAEEAAIRAEFKSKAEISARVHGLWEQQEKERIARKAKGEETYWDKVTGVFKTAEKPGTNDGTAEKK